MKFDFEDIESYENTLTNKIGRHGTTEEVGFINLPFVNVQQLAKLDNQTFLLIQREGSGDLTLKTGGKRWLSIYLIDPICPNIIRFWYRYGDTSPRI